MIFAKLHNLGVCTLRGCKHPLFGTPALYNRAVQSYSLNIKVPLRASLASTCVVFTVSA